MTFHSESSNENSFHKVVGNHAYNALIVTLPETDGKKIKTQISILDPTWAISDFRDYDSTWVRLSQAPNVIREYGDKLDIEKPNIEATKLADEAIERIKQYLFEPKNYRNFFDYLEILPDYASLLTSSSHTEGVSSLNYIWEDFKRYGQSRITFLNKVFDLPAFSKEWENGNEIIYPYVTEVCSHLEYINFANLEHDSQLNELYQKLSSAVTIFSKKNKLENTMYLIHSNYFGVCTQLIRAILESGNKPSDEVDTAIKLFYKLAKKNHSKAIPNSMYEKYLDLIANSD